MLSWIKPKVTKRRPGKPGTFVILLDKSSSMGCCGGAAASEIDAVLHELLGAVPATRVFGFHSILAEATDRSNPSTFGHVSLTSPDRGGSKDNGYRNTNYFGRCLEKIAKFEPCNTVVISDGGFADTQLALQVADAMSGSIDCLYSQSLWEDRAAMEELARRGEGEFKLCVPGVTTQFLRQKLQILRGPRITVQHMAPERTVSGSPTRGDVSVGGSRITVTRP